MILRKIIKFLGTRCHIYRLKSTKFDFGWGSAPDPAGELIALPQTLSLDLRGPSSKRRKRGKEKKAQERTERQGMDGKRGKGRK